MCLTSPCSVTSSTSTKAAVLGVSVGGRVEQTRGVTCSAPNCTVSLMATSNDVMRPVILSRPEKTALGLTIFCAGGAVTISSPGCGAVLAGGGGARRPDHPWLVARRRRHLGAARHVAGRARRIEDAAELRGRRRYACGE